MSWRKKATIIEPNLITNHDMGSEHSNKVIRDRYGSNSFLDTLVTELKEAKRARFAVAFITVDGTQLLLQDLEEALDRGVNIKIITSTYLNFTDPQALKCFLNLSRKYPNFKFRILDATSKGMGHHMKTYIFNDDGDISTTIIGSSNITTKALKTNVEWNIKYDIDVNEEHYKEIDSNFNKLWNSYFSHEINDDWIKKYHEHKRRNPKYIRNNENYHFNKNSDLLSIKEIQQRALNKLLSDYKHSGRGKGILSIATGVGKTHLAAFFAKSVKSENVLFITPREEIAIKARHIFKSVYNRVVHPFTSENSAFKLGEENRENLHMEFNKSDDEFAVLSGKTGLSDNAECIFSVYDSARVKVGESVSEKTLTLMKKSFDIIIIDEAHHTYAKSITKIVNHFLDVNPKMFVLGLTATPYRMDSKETQGLLEFYSEKETKEEPIIFSWSVIDAIENNDLTSLNYFAIYPESLAFTEEERRRKNWELSDMAYKKIRTSASATSIMKTLSRYGWSGHKLRCLIFCMNIEHAEYLTKQLNTFKNVDNYFIMKGNNEIAMCITSKTKDTNRKNIQTRLDDPNDSLQFIVNVNVFGEGMDIPTINTVIFLRQTQSPLVFLQQLGRGLRKSPTKEFLTVFDFVHNNDQVTMMALYELSRKISSNLRLDYDIEHSINNGRNNFFFIKYIDVEQKFVPININAKYQKNLKQFLDAKHIERQIEISKGTENVESLVDIASRFKNEQLITYVTKSNKEKDLYFLANGNKIEQTTKYQNTITKFFRRLQGTPCGALKFIHDVLIINYICENKFQNITANRLWEKYIHVVDWSIKIWAKKLELFYHLFASTSLKSCIKWCEAKQELVFDSIEEIEWDNVIGKQVQETLDYFNWVSKYYFKIDISSLPKKDKLITGELYSNSDMHVFHNNSRHSAQQGISFSKDKKMVHIRANIGGERGNASFDNSVVNDNTIKWLSPKRWVGAKNSTLKNAIEKKNVQADIFVHFNINLFPRGLFWYIGSSKSFKKIGKSGTSYVYNIELDEPMNSEFYNFLVNVL